MSTSDIGLENQTDYSRGVSKTIFFFLMPVEVLLDQPLDDDSKELEQSPTSWGCTTAVTMV